MRQRRSTAGQLLRAIVTDSVPSRRLRQLREARDRVAEQISVPATVAVIGTGLHRALRCTSMVRSMAGQNDPTPARSWICISPSCGLRLTAAIVARRATADRVAYPATVVPVARRATVAVRTVATVAEVAM